MREQAAADSTDQQQQRRGGPPVALDVVQRKQVLVREQVAVDARQHHARQRVVLERAARHRLPAALERHQRQRQQDLPVDLAGAAGRGRDGHDGGGGHGEQHLRAERHAKHPASLGREEAVEAREEERAHAEGQQGDAGFPEPRARRWVDERGEAQADVDGVAWL